MDSNVTKNTFLYKFLKLDVANNNLGLKKVLQEYLLQAIYLYRQKNTIIDSWDSIIVSIPEKLILVNKNNPKIPLAPDQNLSSRQDYFVYRCAIVFPLANFCRKKPLDMARELVVFFSQNNLDHETESYIEIVVLVVPPGWIDFKINYGCLGIWLKQLMVKLTFEQIPRIETHSRDENLHSIRESPNLFRINYYHARCCSLLKLGERERLIKLGDRSFQGLVWPISNPNPILWFDPAGAFLLINPQELNLLHSILSILDRLEEVRCDRIETKIWINWGLDLSRAFDEFMIACRFCGEVKHQNVSLAIARLGLIALVQWCLSKILKEKFQIIPWQEL